MCLALSCSSCLASSMRLEEVGGLAVTPVYLVSSPDLLFRNIRWISGASVTVSYSCLRWRW